MRVFEAVAGGVAAAVVAVLVAARVVAGADLVTVGAVAFLAGFLLVMLRADRHYVEGGRR
jgi:hypothetical protein